MERRPTITSKRELSQPHQLTIHRERTIHSNISVYIAFLKSIYRVETFPSAKN